LFTDIHPATPTLSTLSLHDALPISVQAHPAAAELRRQHAGAGRRRAAHAAARPDHPPLREAPGRGHRPADQVPPEEGRGAGSHRSEEHTSELQSPYDLVCRLLLEKK